MIQDDSNRIPVNRKLLTRFFSKITIHPDVTFNGVTCWIWIAHRNKRGYARFQFAGTNSNAHRVAFGMFVRVIPDTEHGDHLCRRPQCVNPVHIDDVPPRINILRGEGVAAKHARKTHCDNGHEFTPENVYADPKRPNYRCCRACRRVVEQKTLARLRGITAAKPKRTHCKNGHEYTRPAGGPYKHRCLLCMRESAARQRHKLKGANCPPIAVAVANGESDCVTLL